MVVAVAEKVAKGFLAARYSAVALSDYPGIAPTSLEDAYAIQDAALAIDDGEVVGWKVGRIDPEHAARLHVDRLAGPIFARSLRLLESDTRVDGHVFEGGFGAIEAEFVFRLGASPPAGQARFSSENAAALVDAVFVGFEIASSPYAAINADGPLVTISDFGNNNGLLLGPEVPEWRTADFADWTVTTYAHGRELGHGKARTFAGGPLGSVRFLLENLAARGISVPPGLLISTGAITGVHSVDVGDQIRADFGRFATIECRVAAARAHVAAIPA